MSQIGSSSIQAQLRAAGIDTNSNQFKAVILYLMGNTISICAYSTKDESCQADAAIVLGAAAYDDTVSPVYRERLNHGIHHNTGKSGECQNNYG